MTMTILQATLASNFGHYRSKLKSLEVYVAESATVFMWQLGDGRTDSDVPV